MKISSYVLLLVRLPPLSTSSDVLTLGLSSAEESCSRNHQHNAHRAMNGTGREGRIAPEYAALEVSKDEQDEGAQYQDDQQGLANDDAGARLSGDKDAGGGGGDEGGGSLPSPSVDDNDDPGLFGPSGLLSVPKVAALLFLVWVAQVGLNGVERTG